MHSGSRQVSSGIICKLDWRGASNTAVQRFMHERYTDPVSDGRRRHVCAHACTALCATPVALWALAWQQCAQAVRATHACSASMMETAAAAYHCLSLHLHACGAAEREAARPEGLPWKPYLLLPAAAPRPRHWALVLSAPAAHGQHQPLQNGLRWPQPLQQRRRPPCTSSARAVCSPHTHRPAPPHTQ